MKDVGVSLVSAAVTRTIQPQCEIRQHVVKAAKMEECKSFATMSTFF